MVTSTTAQQVVTAAANLAPLGAALAFVGGAVATAWVQASIGSAGMGLLAEKDGKEGSLILFLAIPETLVILGFVIAYLIINH